MYSDACEEALARGARDRAPLQHHADRHPARPRGRKASQKKPTEGRGNIPESEGGWQTVGPSAVAFIPEWQVPVALDRAGMEASWNPSWATWRCARPSA
jgi:hypothetical protein